MQDVAEHVVTDYVLVTVNQKPVITETEEPTIPPYTPPVTPPPLAVIDVPKPVAWGAVGLLLLTSASILLIRIKRSKDKKKGSDYDK